MKAQLFRTIRFELFFFIHGLSFFQVTWLMLSTSMANRLARYTHLHDYDFSSLKILFTGGATMKQESQDLLQNHFSNTFVIQAYGK